MTSIALTIPTVTNIHR